MATYTVCYTKIEAGYMGQLLEWPEVITEGGTLEECRAMLIDAAQEMTRAYLEMIYRVIICTCRSLRLR